jgi:hypothetical protein
MKAVDQTLFGDCGDCFRAALASVLELNVTDVPNFRVTDPDDMNGAAARWLEPQGVRFLPMYFQSQKDLDCTHFDFSMYCLVSGMSSRTNAQGRNRWHAVVGRTIPWGVELLHDPHPDRTFFIPEGERWVKLVVFPPSHPLYRAHVGKL